MVMISSRSYQLVFIASPCCGPIPLSQRPQRGATEQRFLMLHLIDEPTAKLLADKGIWWSLQPLTYDADVFARMSPLSQKKALEVWDRNRERLPAGEKVQNQDGLWYRYFVRCGGCEPPGSLSCEDGPLVHTRRGTQDGHRRQWRVVTLCGFINPYPGKLGVVEEGALAALLLVDGNPLENIKLIEDPDKNLLVIIKDGTIYKNALPK